MQAPTRALDFLVSRGQWRLPAQFRPLFKLLEDGRFREAEVAAIAEARHEGTAGPGRLAIILALSRQGKYQEAKDVAISTLQLEQFTPDVDDAIATALFNLRLFVGAQTLYRRALSKAPDPHILFNLATVARALGNFEEAECALNRVIELTPEDYPAYQLRSDLRTQTTVRNHTADLLRLLTNSKLTDRGKMFLSYALAKELDDLGAYDEAFRWFQRGADTRRAAFTYDVDRDIAKLKRIEVEYSGGMLSHNAPPLSKCSHAFVVGLPRAGTTLIEHILLSHAGVRSNEETDNFSNSLMMRIRSNASDGVEDIFARAALTAHADVGRSYRKIAAEPGFAGVTVEKLPMNYLYAGAIRCALPDSRIIWASRSPIDHCFAMYRTLFGAAYPFSYTFRELASYYGAFRRLMIHWQLSLPEPLHRVRYEELVDRPELEGEGLTSHCGIAWQPEALQFHEDSRACTTASAVQVRRGIHTSSVGRWRNYEKQLAPLAGYLQEEGIFPESDA